MRLAKEDTSVYFAGKISKLDWRHRIAPGLRGIESFDELPFETDYEGILYAGPLMIGCDHGCYHGAMSHGCRGSGHHDVCQANAPSGKTVHEWCLRAIDAADVVFGWIDCPDCYGTLTEIGYAHAKGKPIVLAVASGLGDLYGELWFVRTYAKVVESVGDPIIGFVHCMRMLKGVL